MRIHCLLHAQFEGPGFFEIWAKERGYDFSCTSTYHEKLPTPNEYDFLLIMGGPQSPRESDQFPYLRYEMELIQQSIKRNQWVLGVCLGAQLIAESYGAQTLKSPNKEVGVFPIQLTQEGKENPLLKDFPESLKVMHWHNDMPGLPEDAVTLANSLGCPRQIIQFAPRVYGFQCHMELMQSDIDQLITHCPEDLIAGKYIQTANQMLQEDLTLGHQQLALFLDKFLSIL